MVGFALMCFIIDGIILNDPPETESYMNSAIFAKIKYVTI